MRNFFTSESVTSGHPDKLCDRISDAVLDAYLKEDAKARVACECAATKGFLLVMGEITSDAKIDVAGIARKVIKDTGYDFKGSSFTSDKVEIAVKINRQSPDIAMGVDNSVEFKDGGKDFDKTGAGDQGIMFGYATNETKEFLPLSLVLSHKLCARLEEARRSGELSYLRPDGKSQVTVEYKDGVPQRIDAVVVSSQHDGEVSTERLRKDIKEKVIDKVIDAGLTDSGTKFYINPTGRFEIGGPEGDSGLTGRKIIVDTYGGKAPHGGGCFSGKDPTKVDRSAAYMARYIAKNIVAAGIADECLLQVSYAIGVAKPLSVMVNTFNTGKIADDKLAEIVLKEFDLRPAAIIYTLQLDKPVYFATASYGHFGKEGFSWEKTDKAEDLKKYLTAKI